MKEWVKPFLVENCRRTLIEAGGDRDSVEEWLKIKSADYDNPIWLTDHVQKDFGRGGLDADSQYFCEAFASVLADLTKKVFDKIRSRDVFYVFTPNPGAEVKTFEIEKPLEAGQTIRIVAFPFSSLFDKSPKALRGEIAHEIAHVYLGDVVSDDPESRENRADELAVSWGFGEEIRALRSEQEQDQVQENAP